MKRGLTGGTTAMGQMKKKILIVDDQEINRGILKEILENEYVTIEAVNGKEALAELREEGGEIHAVLLDLVMPEIDGYAFLKSIRNTSYADIPIIVQTGENSTENENRALKLGAWDFVSKPYQPEILLGRLRNAIARSKIGAYEKVRHLAEHDLLTDLYNRQTFYRKTRELIDDHLEILFTFIRFDIDSFNLVNSFWGEKEGDRLLRFSADLIRRALKDRENCTYARINSDIFCICIPDDKEQIRRIVDMIRTELQNFSAGFYIKPTFGIYEIVKPDYPVEAMYERASMAAQKCKGKYNTYVGYYDSGLHDQRVREHEIETEMKPALEKEQFQVYLQPKYDLSTDLPYGAEALVRWVHPERGVISPGTFIPVFERNGFIWELDYYMWDHVCALLRRWIDEGLDPAPVSVNISRISMYNPHIVSKICGLTDRYKIPRSLLNLELTESAYMDNPGLMRGIVENLQEQGFTIMMDDFGSGYSSLNTLKEIHVDILKVDMKFLLGGNDDGRKERILTSIIRMAGWLNIPVIMEGVESARQVRFLRSIGCGYVQGFYFAKPMPWETYEKMIRDTQSAGPENAEDAVYTKINAAVLSDDENLELLFDSLHTAAAIFEYDNGKASPLRVNREYNTKFGYGRNVFSHDLLCREDADSQLRKMMKKIRGNRTGAFDSFELVQENGRKRNFCVFTDRIGEVRNSIIFLAVFHEKSEAIEQSMKGSGSR